MKKILKYQLLINKWKQAGIKYLTHMKTFLEYSYDMKDVYPNINYYNPEKKILEHQLCLMAAFVIVTEVFIRTRKLHIFLVFVPQSYLQFKKNISLKVRYYLIMKILNKQELQLTATNHSSDIDFINFVSFYK